MQPSIPRIALARGGFETCPIQNPDPAAAEGDQVALLEKTGRLVDCAASHPEHFRQLGLRKKEFLR